MPIGVLEPSKSPVKIVESPGNAVFVVLTSRQSRLYFRRTHASVFTSGYVDFSVVCMHASSTVGPGKDH